VASFALIRGILTDRAPPQLGGSSFRYQRPRQIRGLTASSRLIRMADLTFEACEVLRR
jgi:hypothetical protein